MQGKALHQQFQFATPPDTTGSRQTRRGVLRAVNSGGSRSKAGSILSITAYTGVRLAIRTSTSVILPSWRPL